MELILGQLGDRTDEGVWLFIHPHAGDYVTWDDSEDAEHREIFGIPAEKPLPRICVRRWMNPAQRAWQRKTYAKYRRLGEIPHELEEKIQREMIANTVLIDWDRIAPPSGDAQAYRPELGIQALKADPIFQDAVVGASTKERNFRERAIQEDADVLGKPSDGSSSGDPS